MKILKDFCGAMIVAATLILMLGLENLAGADSAVVIEPGGTVVVTCEASTPGPEPTPTPTPTPTPPAPQCPDFTNHAQVLPANMRDLRKGEETIRVDNGHSAHGLLFNPSTFWPGVQPGVVKRFTYAPHAVPQSKIHTLTFSQCPGDFRINALPGPCWGNGNEGSIRVVVQNNQHPTYCTLKPDTYYYLNIAGVYPGSMRGGGGGGVLVKVPR